MSLLEVDGNAIASLTCEPASLALPPVLRVNVADGYERDSGRWARLRGRCFLVPGDVDGREEHRRQSQDTSGIAESRGSGEQATDDNNTADGVGDTHQWCVQGCSYTPNHLPTHEYRQNKDGQVL